MLKHPEAWPKHKESDMAKSKACGKCAQIKLLSFFPKCAQCKDGHRPVCKTCAYQEAAQKRNLELEKKRVAEYRAKNLQKELQRCSNYRAKNPEKIRQASFNWKMNNPQALDKWALNRQKRLEGKVFKIRLRFINRLRASSCFYCGSNQKIELDHLLPIARGGQHSEGNLVPACRSCNRSKGQKLLTEWKKTKPRATYNSGLCLL